MIMNRHLFTLFFLLFVTLAVVAAPVNLEKDILNARAKKAAVARPKPVAKPAVKPQPVAKKPVAKPTVPVAAPARKPAVKPASVAKPAVKPAPKPQPIAVAQKPVAKPAAPVAAPARKPVAKTAVKPAPVAKPAVKPAPKPKPVAAAKPIAKPVAKPIAKTTTKPAAKPIARPVAKLPTKPAVKPIAKPVPRPVAKPAAKPAVKPVTNPVAKPVANPDNTVTPNEGAPAAACPLPPRKSVVRRFLELFVLARSTAPPTRGRLSKQQHKALRNRPRPGAAPDCGSAPAAPAPAAPAPVQAPAPLPAGAGDRPVGNIVNKPTTAVKCINRDGVPNKIPLLDIETAITLAQTNKPQPKPADGGPIKLFPHFFGNRNDDGDEEVRLAAQCAGQTGFVEHAVNKGMSFFKNDEETIKKFPFRVVITPPDANGNTIFCGVITHGPTSNMGGFLPDICPPA